MTMGTPNKPTNVSESSKIQKIAKAQLPEDSTPR